MAGYESTTICGELKKDPELKYAASGNPVCRLSLVVDIKVGDEYKAKWWNVTCFGKTAELVANLCAKGTVIVVTGITETDPQTMTTPIYMKDDAPRTSNKLIARTVDFVTGFGKKAAKEQPSATQEEIPF